MSDPCTLRDHDEIQKAAVAKGDVKPSSSKCVVCGNYRPASVLYYVPVAREPHPAMVASFERARAIAQNHGVARFAIADWDGLSLSIEAKRNIAVCKLLREKDFEYILMIDDDMDFRHDPEAISKLITEARALDADIIAPLMVRRGAPHYVAYNKDRGKPDDTRFAYKAYQDNLTFPVTGHVGTGVILINRRVIEALEPPWFETQLDWACKPCKALDIPAPDCKGCNGTGKDFSKVDVSAGEDTYFCRKAIDAGFSCYVAAGIIVGHLADKSTWIEDAIQVQFPVVWARGILADFEKYQEEIVRRKKDSLILPEGPSLVIAEPAPAGNGLKIVR